jgi:hypothetical protein
MADETSLRFRAINALNYFSTGISSNRGMEEGPHQVEIPKDSYIDISRLDVESRFELVHVHCSNGRDYRLPMDKVLNVIGRPHLDLEERSWANAQVFVAMPFAGKWKGAYEDVKDVVESKGARCFRADESVYPGRIDGKVHELIAQSDVVIAVIPPEGNGNVMYEVGFAHAKEIPTILVAGEKKMPSDLEGHVYLEYDPWEKDLFRTKLGRSLVSIFERRFDGVRNVHRFLSMDSGNAGKRSYIVANPYVAPGEQGTGDNLGIVMLMYAIKSRAKGFGWSAKDPAKDLELIGADMQNEALLERPDLAGYNFYLIGNKIIGKLLNRLTAGQWEFPAGD